MAEQAMFYNLPYDFDRFMVIERIRESKRTSEAEISDEKNVLGFSVQSNNFISLKLIRTAHTKPELDFVPSYFFQILYRETEIGELNLRIGYNENIYFGGNLSCKIAPEFQGLGYGVRACKLVLPLVKFHKMELLSLSCDYTNSETQNTCKVLGAEHRRRLFLPSDHPLYLTGKRCCDIYFWHMSDLYLQKND